MRSSAKAFLSALAVVGIVGLPGCTNSDPSNEVAQAFKRGFVNGYVRAASKRGRDPQQARVEGNCIYEALSSRLTALDWVQLAAASKEGSGPPQRIAPVLKEASSRCLHPERTATNG
jgi:hypothetical protein